jgi:hypothetical protein
VCALIAWAICASSGWAVPLLPNQTVLAAAEPDPVGGVVVGGPLVSPFAGVAFGGTLVSSVIAGDPSNPLGGLTFTYQILGDPRSANAIGRLTITDYMGWLTDVSYQVPLAGLQPTMMDRSLLGNVVGFSFIGQPLGAGTLPPGASSAVFVVQTNAPAFASGLASVIDGSVAGNIATYAPVPEPATLCLLAMGGLMAWRRQCAR